MTRDSRDLQGTTGLLGRCLPTFVGRGFVSNFPWSRPPSSVELFSGLEESDPVGVGFREARCETRPIIGLHSLG